MIPPENIIRHHHQCTCALCERWRAKLKVPAQDESKGTAFERAADGARKWCRENPGWEPICDMAGTDHLYFGWDDLTRGQKLSWRNRYGDGAKEMFAEQTHPCKVANGWVDENSVFSSDIPFGRLGMMVFQTGNLPQP